MTTDQLIQKLQEIVKKNPKAANMEVVMAQYDTVGNDDGVESTYNVKENGLRQVVIS